MATLETVTGPKANGPGLVGRVLEFYPNTRTVIRDRQQVSVLVFAPRVASPTEAGMAIAAPPPMRRQGGEPSTSRTGEGDSAASSATSGVGNAVGESAGPLLGAAQRVSSISARFVPEPGPEDAPLPTLARANADLDRAILYGLGFLGGVISLFMGIGVIAELERGHTLSAIVLGSGALSQLGVLAALAFGGWQCWNRLRGHPGGAAL